MGQFPWEDAKRTLGGDIQWRTRYKHVRLIITKRIPSMIGSLYYPEVQGHGWRTEFRTVKDGDGYKTFKAAHKRISDWLRDMGL